MVKFTLYPDQINKLTSTSQPFRKTSRTWWQNDSIMFERVWSPRLGYDPTGRRHGNVLQGSFHIITSHRAAISINLCPPSFVSSIHADQTWQLVEPTTVPLGFAQTITRGLGPENTSGDIFPGLVPILFRGKRSAMIDDVFEGYWTTWRSFSLHFVYKANRQGEGYCSGDGSRIYCIE